MWNGSVETSFQIFRSVFSKGHISDFFFNWDSRHEDWTAVRGMELQEKEAQK